MKGEQCRAQKASLGTGTTARSQKSEQQKTEPGRFGAFCLCRRLFGCGAGRYRRFLIFLGMV